MNDGLQKPVGRAHDINTDFKFDPVAAFDKKDDEILALRAAVAHEADVAQSYKEQYEAGLEMQVLLRKALKAAWDDGYCFHGPEGYDDAQQLVLAALDMSSNLDCEQYDSKGHSLELAKAQEYIKMLRDAIVQHRAAKSDWDLLAANATFRKVLAATKAMR